MPNQASVTSSFRKGFRGGLSGYAGALFESASGMLRGLLESG